MCEDREEIRKQIEFQLWEVLNNNNCLPNWRTKESIQSLISRLTNEAMKYHI